MRRLKEYLFNKQNRRVLSSKGFTLLELLVIVAVVSIMVTIAGMSLVSSTQNAELRSVAREMYGQFQRAKMEAIKRNQPVAIVFDTTGIDQYQVFVDLDNDKVLDAGEPLVAEIVMKNGIELQSISFGGNDETGFTPRGRPTGGSGTVDIVNTVTSKKFQLTTTIAGYVHLVKL